MITIIYLSPNELKRAKRKLLEARTRELIENCIKNIKLSRTSNSPYKKNTDGVTHHYLKEIIILMFSKTNLGIKKRYSETILNQLASLDIKNKTIKKYIDKYANDEIKEIMKNFDTSFKNLDLGAYLFNNEADYVGFHCDYVSTAMMTLEASYGNIPIFNVFANQVNVNGNIRAMGDITAIGNLNCNGLFTFNGGMSLTGVGDVAGAINSKLPASAKGFDIPHPNKEGHRLRHICVEGPESGPIYIRGKLKGTSITVPDYWDGLIDKDSISVNLTPIGSYQELYVDTINWGKKIQIKNREGGPIECYYQVWANRLGENLYVEYEGESPANYPGDSSQYSIAGYNYDRRT